MGTKIGTLGRCQGCGKFWSLSQYTGEVMYHTVHGLGGSITPCKGSHMLPMNELVVVSTILHILEENSTPAEFEVVRKLFARSPVIKALQFPSNA